MRYICTETFRIEIYDDEGFQDGEIIVEKGAVYERYPDRHYCNDVDESAIHLEDDDGNWIEIMPERFEAFFKEM